MVGLRTYSFGMKSGWSWLALTVYTLLATGPVAQGRQVGNFNAKRYDNQTYDYIIVGGGLSGLVVANRLSEDPSVSVLVIEYGVIDRSNITSTPTYALNNNWVDMFNFSSAPEPYMENQTFSILAGAVVGGGSVVNGMEFDRASAADYDAWEQLGNPGWGWEGISPYFKKSTKFTPPPADIEAMYNYTWTLDPFSVDGPLQASFPKFQYPDVYKFYDAMEELELPFVVEQNAGDAVGWYWTLTSLDPKTETRSSALTAYHDPAANRSNLHFALEHQVVEILMTNLTAEGVKALSRKDNSTSSFFATKEVILAAGGPHTPHILQLSGIGPKAILEAAGIDVKLDMPAVGSNFQDHPTAYVYYNLTNPSFPNANTLTTNATFNAIALEEYHENKTGPYTLAHGNLAVWLNLSALTPEASSLISALHAQNATAYLPDAYASEPKLLAGFRAQRDILVQNFKAGDVAVYEFPFNGAGFVPNTIQKPLSRGTVYLNASNPSGEPVITHYAMQNPFDRAQLGAAVNYTRKIFQTSAVSTLGPVELVPGPDNVSAEAIVSALLAAGSLSPTFAHPSCSCPMMPKELGGCVGPDLLFYGVGKLSIVDASIIPIIPAAHLQATMYGIAEKAADIIKSRA